MKKITTDNTYIVPALARGLKLIELLSGHSEGLTMASMTELALPQATLFRMLTTLVSCGYAVREPDGSYHLSSKLLKIAARNVENPSLTVLAEPVMRELRDLTGESVMLGLLHDGHGIVLQQCVSNQPVKVMVEIGHHFPLHTAAPAKAILAFSSPDETEKVLKSINFIRYTSATIRNRSAYRKELDAVRRSGIAFDRGEELEDFHCLAAPVLNNKGVAVAAIWISGPASRFTEKVMHKDEAPLRRAAKTISERLAGI